MNWPNDIISHNRLLQQNLMRAGRTIALDKRVNNLLAHAANLFAIALAAMLVRFFAANVSGVGFDDLTGSAHWAFFAVGVHGFANAHRHEPSGLVGDAQSPMQLVRGEAFLGCGV
jgi:hypothetical protein